MPSCFIILLLTILISATLMILKSFYPNYNTKKTRHPLPPGPPTIPFFGNLLIWLLLKPFHHVVLLASSLSRKYGPIYTLQMGSKPFIIITSHSLAHQALIAKGTVFADRPQAVATDKYFTSNQHNISSGLYRPTWFCLRRNLSSNILHSSRITSYACARKWALDTLISRLKSISSSNDHNIEVMEHIQHAFFSLLTFICFGEKVDEMQIQDIKDVQRHLQLSFDKFKILNMFPRLGKYVFYRRWKELYQLRQHQEEIMVPLIKARKSMMKNSCSVEPFLPYVDTLFDIQLKDENRKLEQKEIVTLCSEFLTAGTETTSTALEWIMANLVKYPHIQEKLFNEIKGVVDDGDLEIKEEDLRKMPYLRAVILEGLRHHPPSHLLIPHSVTDDVVLGGFLVPKNSVVIFIVAEMGQNPNLWENPVEFKPERFLNDRKAFDITGINGIKMMPFGVGRRMCPAYRFAILILEYFVANLVWHFKWFNGLKRDDVDFTEKHEFTTVMENPLQVHIIPRLPVP